MSRAKTLAPSHLQGLFSNQAALDRFSWLRQYRDVVNKPQKPGCSSCANKRRQTAQNAYDEAKKGIVAMSDEGHAALKEILGVDSLLVLYRNSEGKQGQKKL